MAESRSGGFSNRPRFQGGGGNPQGRSTTGGGHAQGSGSGQRQEWPPQFPYKPQYFFDEKGNLREELLTSFAEQQAEAF